MPESRKSSPPLKHCLIGWLILICGVQWQCAGYQAIFYPMHRTASPDLSMRQVQMQALAQISGVGQMTVDAPNFSVALPFGMELILPDTLQVQISDPLGRKLAQLVLAGDAYELRYLREGRTISGSDLPTSWGEWTLPALSAADLRNILLALPLYDLHSQDRQVHYYLHRRLSTLRQMDITTTQQAIKISYSRYEPTAGVDLPQSITIVEKPAGWRVEIHFSHITGRMIKLNS